MERPTKISDEAFPTLAPGVFLKRLEEPCLYHVFRDELYRLSEEAFSFFLRCDGSLPLSSLRVEPDFLEYCLEEGLLVLRSDPHPVPVRVGINERPSLRYLMVEVTGRCNLHCLHCYLGEPKTSDMEPSLFRKLSEEYEAIGGLRFIVTGGEPLLHPNWDELVSCLPGKGFRSVLVTNGVLLSGLGEDKLPFHEIQISLDGLEEGHDHLRGPGSFHRAFQGLRHVRNMGKEVSVATVVHSRNLQELEELGELLRHEGVSAWTLEYPVPEGRLTRESDLLVPLEEALPFLELGWGPGPHDTTGTGGCGHHLACVTPEGILVKCGYYRDLEGGDAGKGLRDAWKKLPRIPPPKACRDCPELPSCGGGCLYRGSALCGPGSPDPLACLQRGRMPSRGGL